MQITLEISGASDFYDQESFVKVDVTQGDYERWKNLAALVKEHRLYCVEEWDYRCEFFYEDYEEGGLVEAAFRQDASRLQVTDQEVRWTGYAKHCGPESEWSTGPIRLEDLGKIFAEPLL